MAKWYSTDWWHRVPVIVKASQAGGATHADYPCLLASSLPAHLWGRVRSDGLDCVLTAADGVTPLYREVATFDVAGERPEVYFRLPSYSHLEDTLVHLYYRNPDYSEPSDVAVWPTDTWAAVYHMNDNPADNTQILDSTANRNHGTKGADTRAPTEVPGTVGRAQRFVEANATYIGFSPVTLDKDGCSVSALATLHTTPAEPFGAFVLSGGTRYYKYLGYDSTRHVRSESNTNNDNWVSVAPVAATLDVPHCWTVNGNTAVTMYFNGVASTVRTPADDLTVRRIGLAHNDGTYGALGATIDELRISSVARSAEWIAAEDHWLRNNSLCYEVGAYEHRPLYIMQGYRRTTDGASATPQTYRRVSERTEYVAQGYRRLTLPAEYIAQGYRRVVNKALYTIATKRRLRPLYRILGRPSYGMDHHPKPDYGLGPNGRPDDRNL